MEHIPYNIADNRCKINLPAVPLVIGITAYITEHIIYSVLICKTVTLTVPGPPGADNLNAGNKPWVIPMTIYVILKIISGLDCIAPCPYIPIRIFIPSATGVSSIEVTYILKGVDIPQWNPFSMTAD